MSFPYQASCTYDIWLRPSHIPSSNIQSRSLCLIYWNCSQDTSQSTIGTLIKWMKKYLVSLNVVTTTFETILVATAIGCSCSPEPLYVITTSKKVFVVASMSHFVYRKCTVTVVHNLLVNINHHRKEFLGGHILLGYSWVEKPHYFNDSSI